MSYPNILNFPIGTYRPGYIGAKYHIESEKFYMDFQKATVYYFKENDGKRANSGTNSGARG